MLTQQSLPPPLTSTVRSSLFTQHIPVHSPWLPVYIDVPQTVLLILTMAGLFPYRPHHMLPLAITSITLAINKNESPGTHSQYSLLCTEKRYNISKAIQRYLLQDKFHLSNMAAQPHSPTSGNFVASM